MVNSKRSWVSEGQKVKVFQGRELWVKGAGGELERTLNSGWREDKLSEACWDVLSWFGEHLEFVKGFIRKKMVREEAGAAFVDARGFYAGGKCGRIVLCDGVHSPQWEWQVRKRVSLGRWQSSGESAFGYSELPVPIGTEAAHLYVCVKLQSCPCGQLKSQVQVKVWQADENGKMGKDFERVQKG